MKYLAIFTAIFLFQLSVYSQIEYKDQLIENTVYSNAPEEIKNTKPFIRQWRFFEERAYPDGVIPKDAYENSIEQRNLLREQNREEALSINWVSRGPTPGAYFNYGNIYRTSIDGGSRASRFEIRYLDA